MNNTTHYQNIFAESRQRYTQYYLDFLKNHDPDSQSLRLAKDEILLAIQYDLESSMPSYSWVLPISKFLNRTGDYQIAISFLEQVMQKAPDTLKLEGFLFYGMFLRKVGNTEGAIASHEQGITLAEQLQDAQTLAILMGKLGHLMCRIGELEKGEAFLLKSLPIIENFNEPQNLIDIYIQLGYLYDDKSDYHAALHYFNLAAEIATKNHFLAELVSVYVNLSVTHNNLGNTDVTSEYLYKSIELAKEIDFKESEGFASLNLGHIEQKRNNLDESKALLEKAIEIAKQLGHTYMLVFSMMNLSATIDLLGDEKTALHLLDEGISMMADLNDQRLFVMLHYEKAELFAYHKDWIEAYNFHSTTHVLAVKHDYHDFEGKALFGMAQASKRLGNISDAVEKAKAGYQILSEIEHVDKDEILKFIEDIEEEQ